MAARIIGRINKKLAVKLNIPQLFLFPTVEGLAALVERNRQIGNHLGTESNLEMKAIPRTKEDKFGSNVFWTGAVVVFGSITAE